MDNCNCESVKKWEELMDHLIPNWRKRTNVKPWDLVADLIKDLEDEISQIESEMSGLEDEVYDLESQLEEARDGKN